MHVEIVSSESAVSRITWGCSKQLQIKEEKNNSRKREILSCSEGTFPRLKMSRKMGATTPIIS